MIVCAIVNYKNSKVKERVRVSKRIYNIFLSEIKITNSNGIDSPQLIPKKQVRNKFIETLLTYNKKKLKNLCTKKGNI